MSRTHLPRIDIDKTILEEVGEGDTDPKTQRPEVETAINNLRDNKVLGYESNS